MGALLLHRVSGVVSSGLGLDRILQELIALAVEATACDACLVYLLDRETGELVLRASQLSHTAEIGTVRMRLGEGVTGWVAEHRAVVALSRDASGDDRFKRFPTLVEDSFEAFLSVPLVGDGETIGVVNVHHKAVHQHTPEEIALAAFLGEQLGGAIRRAELGQQNEQLRREAQDAQRQLEERKVIERAKGILQQKYSLTEQDAYTRLRNESRRLRRPLRELAEAVLLAEGLAPEPGPRE